MRCELFRIKTGNQGTFGVLVTASMRVYHTIELPWRLNKPFVSCITPGVYHASVQPSPRFRGKMLYRLADAETAPRSAILLHVGNWAGDRSLGLKSDFDGCIGLGTGYTDDLGGQAAITNSSAAIEDFLITTKCQPIELHIHPVGQQVAA